MYHAVGTAVTNFSEKLPTTQGELAQEILKSNYDLGFISLPPKYDENALEDVLEQRMTRFLLELGEGSINDCSLNWVCSKNFRIKKKYIRS